MRCTPICENMQASPIRVSRGQVARQILRHSKMAITMEIYTEVMSSATREALGKLGDQLGP